jgi:bisphosphoglycerate-independent phosphoglycerate mutase (AlkP superfamily)
MTSRLDDSALTLMIVSDHGNIEDLSVKTHTLNPVPTIAVGSGADYFQPVESLMDIFPSVLQFFNLKPMDRESDVSAILKNSEGE